jgi:hypothetical protein
MGNILFYSKRLLRTLLNRAGYTLVRNVGSEGKKDIQIRSIQKNYRLLARSELYNRISHLSGAIVEAGVGAGSGLAIFALLEDSREFKRKIWAFDSFSGFPPGTNQDSLEFQKSGKPEYKEFSEDFVMAILRSIQLSEEILENITFCKGYMPSSFSKFDLSPVALLNVDVDLYQSTKDVLDFFWPLMQSTGIVILDEYDSNSDSEKWPGAKKAVDEFCVMNQVVIQRSVGHRAFLMKP